MMADRGPEVHLILGGVRSGKSAFAEGLATDLGLHTVYLATGQVMDEEMEERIQSHRRRRPVEWDTLEESLNLPECLRQLPGIEERTHGGYRRKHRWMDGQYPAET